MEGHHISYLSALVNGMKVQNDVVCILPEEVPGLGVKQHVLDTPDRKVRNYIEYMKSLGKIIADEKPDIIHFLYADFFYRYFGLGIGKVRRANCRIIGTLHSIPNSSLKMHAVFSFCKKIDCSVVHTETLADILESHKISCVHAVSYPCFMKKPDMSKNEACDHLELDNNIPVIAAMGGTRRDKGLDLLMTALSRIKLPFQLLVAGKEDEIRAEQIIEITKPYSGQVKTLLKTLSDEEYSLCLLASDIIALPYRKILSGASGPLAEGVLFGKTIVSSDYGSIGNIVRDNHLGYLWNTDSIDDMVNVLNDVLSSSFEYDDKACSYRDNLAVSVFLSRYENIYKCLC